MKTISVGENSNSKINWANENRSWSEVVRGKRRERMINNDDLGR